MSDLPHHFKNDQSVASICKFLVRHVEKRQGNDRGENYPHSDRPSQIKGTWVFILPKIDIKNGVFRRRRGQTSDAGLDDRQLLAALFDGRFHAHARKMAEDLAKQAWFVRVQTVESTTEPTAIDFAVGKPTKCNH